MDIPQPINRVVFAEKNLQLLKLWQWSVSAVHEDKETGIFEVLFRGSHFNGGGASTFINPDGSRLTPLEFDYIDNFHDGLAIIAVPGKGYGYINTAGEIIVPMIYENACFFHNNFSWVEKNSKWMLIDRFGKEITLSRKYKNFGWMSDGRCPVSTKILTGWREPIVNGEEYVAGLWGFIDESGNEIIKPQYLYAANFENGLAVVCKRGWKKGKGKFWHIGELWGVIDINGKEVIPCQHDEIDVFNDTSGIFQVHTGGWETGKWGVMDRTGKWLAPPVVNSISCDYQDGLFVFYEYRNASGDGIVDKLYGVYDIPNQQVLFEPQFFEIDFMNDGLFCVKIIDADGNGREKIIDRNGREIFPSDYSFIDCCTKPHLVIKRKGKDSLSGLIDTDGSVVLPCKYKTPFFGISYEDQTIIFIRNGRQGMMDFDENILIPADKQGISRLARNLYCFKKNNLYGIVSKSGQIVLPAEYEKISLCRNNRIIAHSQNGVEVFEIKYIS